MISLVKKMLDKLANFVIKNARFTGGRPIKVEEKLNRLPQGKPSLIPVAWPQLSVIRMNSTYLECTNYHFGDKGFITMGGFWMLPIALSVPIFCLFALFNDWSSATGSNFAGLLFACSGGIFMFTPLLALVIFVLKLENFTLTHFPMRFNRKTRMVHVFLESEKGKILSIPWDDVFFTCSTFGGLKIFGGGGCSVVGFKMSEDGETVEEAFELADRNAWDSEYRFLQWEFVRQYMEGDEAKLRELANMVDYVQDVAEHRETLYASFMRTLAQYSGGYIHFMIISFPIVLLVTLGRQIAMWTCKIPRWPAEIEATCQYPANDPILRDAQHHLPRGTAIMPDVSRYAGR
ncbi:MAG: hypothetical protein FWG26_08705 [Betaproteobacteria bacterium]|nr:hypothetical protein [Betaproteobacteria bacterium]